MKRVFLSIIVCLCCLSGISQSINKIKEFENAAYNGYKAIQIGNVNDFIYWAEKCENLSTSPAYEIKLYQSLAYTYYTGTIAWFMKEQELVYGKAGKSVDPYATNLHVSQNWALSAQYKEKELKGLERFVNKGGAGDKRKRSVCIEIGEIYENGGPGLSQNLTLAKKWFKKGLSYTGEKDESFLLCEKALARVEQKGTMLASSASTSKPAKEEKPVMVETPKPKQDVAVAEKPKQQVEQKVDQKPKAPQISTIDISIPNNSQKNTNTFAFIIANEDYKRVEAVPYAANDGKIFAEYCQKTLGVPEKNLHVLSNATLGDIKYNVSQMKQIAEAFDGEAQFILYYAGHGLPAENQQDAFLLPVDGYGADGTGYSMNELYGELGALNAKSVVVLLDACFSGSKRDGGMIASARGVAIKAKQATPKGNLVVLSAAQGDETAYPYKEQGHGLFTYYLLKKLNETKGDVTLGELADYITSNVKKTSIVENGKLQTPTVVPSSEMGNSWRSMKLK